VGSGIILGGALYHGHHWTAGEIGHVIIQADAPLGRRTLENLGSRTAIAQHLRSLVEANHASRLVEIVEGDLSAIRSSALNKALRQQDGLTRMVVQQAASYVGTAIANTVTLLSLPCVVLGGGLTTALGNIWLEWVRQAFEGRVFPEELRTCKLLAGQLGDDAGAVGAADLARRRLGP
jgi:glucokinase